MKRVSKSAKGSKSSRSADGRPARARAGRSKPNANVTGRLRFESFLLELSAYFAKAPADNVDRDIGIWLEKLGQVIGIDRIGLWECDTGGVHVYPRHIYSAPGLQASPPRAFDTDFPWLNAQLRRGRIVSWARVPKDIPAVARAERAHAIRIGAKSMLGIPVEAGTIFYVLTFTCLRAYRTWPRTLVQRLQLTSEIFASAFVRLSAERSLLASESRNRAILQALPDLIFVLSPEGVFVECHCPETVDLLVPPDEFLGRTMEEVLPPDTARLFRSAFQRAAGTGELVELEYVLPIGGDERHFEARVVRRDDRALVAVVRNITERHRAAERLRASEQQFRVAFTHSAIGMALVSLEGNFLQVNERLCGILGYSESELLSTTFQALTHREDLASTLARFRRTLAGEISHYELEKRYIHKDGRIVWGLLAVALVKNASNEPLHFVSQLQDISERRQSQIEIERARLELAHIGRVSLVGQLTASLAHELLQPITAVVSNAETGLHFPDLASSSEIRALLEDIAESGRRAGDIIHNVRGLLRKAPNTHTRVDLNRLVEEVLLVMQSDLRLHHIRLVMNLDSANLQITGDRVELQQVLLNLMLNGTEAMSAIPVQERQLVIETMARVDAVELSVKDSGTGLAPDDLKRLFEPFFTTKPDGVGMGLPICAKIVRDHKGKLWAENNTDRGMTWHCVLPRG